MAPGHVGVHVRFWFPEVVQIRFIPQFPDNRFPRVPFRQRGAEPCRGLAARIGIGRKSFIIQSIPVINNEENPYAARFHVGNQEVILAEIVNARRFLGTVPADIHADDTHSRGLYHGQVFFIALIEMDVDTHPLWNGLHPEFRMNIVNFSKSTTILTFQMQASRKQ
ncbi:MAG: hypothetical protein BWX80_00269 [Candidatus Hydrogenedentes bacterium ADurb.Bin101]|nr:MAG: hypothetical protein BWX80_00269 [Candidatus Hydrogenedentes bacterium ADurb.Bin101]